MSILRAQTRKFHLENEINLEEIAAAMPSTVTGADIGAVTSRAFNFALENKLALLETQGAYYGRDGVNEKEELEEEEVPSNSRVAAYLNTLSDEELKVQVSLEDFLCAVREYVPSVSAKGHLYYEQLKEMYES